MTTWWRLGGMNRSSKPRASCAWKAKEYIVQDGDVLNIRFSPPAK